MEIFQLPSAIKICNKARDVGLNVMFSTQTLGNGNCSDRILVITLKSQPSPAPIVSPR